MAESFQKTANYLQELTLSHPGIIEDTSFHRYFTLHCYKPSKDLAPFVEHIWVQRKKQPSPPSQKPPIEILSGPNMYLFFTAGTAFIHDITRQEFEYDAFASEVTAGVKFRPGGFSAFLQGPVSDFDTANITAVFPTADNTYARDLLEQTDEVIVEQLETLLLSKKPKDDEQLKLIARILSALEKDGSLTTRSIAHTFHMSECSLQLLFQRYVGVSLKWIIMRKRFLKVTRYIRHKKRHSWTEIAAELGYNSQSHLSREFKEVIGQSPSKYIKNIR